MSGDCYRMTNLALGCKGVVSHPLAGHSLLGILAAFDRDQFHQCIPKPTDEDFQQLGLVDF
jgi:hypothetical protein